MTLYEMEKSNLPQGVAGAPNEAALLALMEATGYTMLQENGQRKYGGPPPNWEGPSPPRGCEIFVGKIPRDCYEDELVPVFEKIGTIYEFRLMMDFSGSNRGYGFVMYTKREDAQRAVRELNNYEIRRGRLLGVCYSVDNCRLFVGGIPKNKIKNEILTEMIKVTEGVTDVIVYPSVVDKTKNRGFAFVEYETHRAAAMARRKLIPGRIQLWGHQIAVDWAEPEQEVDEDVMLNVRILYVRNLMLSTTEDRIREIFSKPFGRDDIIERVKKIRDYAFVHYRDREDAIKAMKALNGSTLDGSKLEVVLAKPADKSYVRITREAKTAYAQTDQELEDGKENDEQTHLIPPILAYTFDQTGTAILRNGTSTAYVQQPACVSASSSSPIVNGVAATTTLRGRGRGSAGSRGAGAQRYLQQYARGIQRQPVEGNMYELLPGMDLIPTNPVTLKPHNVKSATQILEDFCSKNGWGSPLYHLHSTVNEDGSGDVQLFLFKVNIPAIRNSFQPSKLCSNVEDAKTFAAEYVLLQLGVPYEGSHQVESTPDALGRPATYPRIQAWPEPPRVYLPPSARTVHSDITASATPLPPAPVEYRYSVPPYTAGPPPWC